MVVAIEKILAYTRGMDLKSFERTLSVADAVSYNFVIIGEAANHVPDDVVASHPEIDWRQMRGLRNRLVHEYFGADVEIVWQTIEEDLPQVLPHLRALLGSGH